MPLMDPASEGNHLYPSCSQAHNCITSAVDTEEALGNLLSGVLLLCFQHPKAEINPPHIIDLRLVY